MARKIRDKKEVTIAEAKEVLDSFEELSLFQARTLEYANRFSKVDPSRAKELVDKLIERFDIERKDAVQVVNCMPLSIQELRAFFSTGRKRVILTSQLRDMLKTLDDYR